LADYVRQNVTVLHKASYASAPKMSGRSRRRRASSASKFGYQCPDAQSMSIHSSGFFPIVPTHVTYAQIVTDKGAFISQLLTATQQTLELSSASGQSPLQNASFFEYIVMGIMHIFTGYESPGVSTRTGPDLEEIARSDFSSLPASPLAIR